MAVKKEVKHENTATVGEKRGQRGYYGSKKRSKARKYRHGGREKG